MASSRARICAALSVGFSPRGISGLCSLGLMGPRSDVVVSPYNLKRKKCASAACLLITRQSKPFSLRNLDRRSAISTIIQVRHWKVRVAADPYFRQMHEGDVAAPAVHGIPPQPRHLREKRAIAPVPDSCSASPECCRRSR